MAARRVAAHRHRSAGRGTWTRIVTRTIAFDELPAAFPAYLDGRVTGRTVVRIR